VELGPFLALLGAAIEVAALNLILGVDNAAPPFDRADS